MAFCRWLGSFSETADARLPSEEEWEYSSRAGTTSRFWSGDREKDLDLVGWYEKNSGGKTHPVGQKPANPWGLFDMHGNVREWCTSLWSEDYQGRESGVSVDPASASAANLVPASSEPVHPRNMTEDCRGTRVTRGRDDGGTFQGARSAFRNPGSPGSRFGDQGFRVLLPPKPPGASR